MSYTYRITLLGMAIDTSKCPPDLMKVVFPSFDGQPCTVASDYYEVIFEEEQTPVDLGPLVKVTLIDTNQQVS